MRHVAERTLCYRNRRKLWLWQADYQGVIELDGTKYWLFLREMKTRLGDPCIEVQMRLKVEEAS